MRYPTANTPRIPIRRSAEGRVLGVFRGVAEHAKFPLLWTRVLGIFSLLGVGAGLESVGCNPVVAAVLLYLLLAWLMLPPVSATVGGAIGAVPVNGFGAGRGSGASRLRPSFPTGGTGAGQPVDLASLERQLDAISRRISRMESIVVTREADWDRRLRGV